MVYDLFIYIYIYIKHQRREDITYQAQHYRIVFNVFNVLKLIYIFCN